MGHYDSCYEAEDEYDRKNKLGPYSKEAIEEREADPILLLRRIKKLEKKVEILERRIGS